MILTSSGVKLERAGGLDSEPIFCTTIFRIDVNPLRSFVAIFSISCICLCVNVTAFSACVWTREIFEREQFPSKASCGLIIPLDRDGGVPLLLLFNLLVIFS